MIFAIQEEENKLEERWKCLENIEKIRLENESLKEQVLLLQKSYLMQQQELLILKENGKFSEISEDWKDRIESIKIKEQELAEFEEQLKKERDDIDISAALIKQLNLDLEKQKNMQTAEQKKLNDLVNEIKAREAEFSRIDTSNIDIDKSFKNSSNGSIRAILVSDMSPFEDKEILNVENPFAHHN